MRAVCHSSAKWNAIRHLLIGGPLLVGVLSQATSLFSLPNLSATDASTSQAIGDAYLCCGVA